MIELIPLNGIAKESNRTELRIHGGASGTDKWSPRGRDYLSDYSGRDNLRPTQGCLRVSNENATKLYDAIKEYRAYRDTFNYQIEKAFYESIGRSINNQDLVHVR